MKTYGIIDIFSPDPEKNPNFRNVHFSYFQYKLGFRIPLKRLEWGTGVCFSRENNRVLDELSGGSSREILKKAHMHKFSSE
jgi:hypothetical protein